MLKKNAPTKRYLESPLLWAVLFFLVGILFWGGFNWGMEITNTESFCISCHEMKENVYKEYQSSAHYSNKTGVRATCPDCHVPKEWVHKVSRKIKATNELYHWLRGSIDTPQKFQAKRFKLANHVWESMTETDSRECRNCHASEHMALKKQSLMAKKSHQLGEQWGYSCIQCHQGIAHQLPDEFDKEKQLDAFHKKIEHQNVPCYECHESMYRPPENNDW